VEVGLNGARQTVRENFVTDAWGLASTLNQWKQLLWLNEMA